MRCNERSGLLGLLTELQTFDLSDKILLSLAEHLHHVFHIDDSSHKRIPARLTLCHTDLFTCQYSS